MKDKLRKVFRFLQAKEQGRDEYGNNGFIVLSRKKYFVGKMSYDEWYLEPFYKGRTEKDVFSKKCLWEKGDTITILDLFEENKLINVTVM